MLLPVTKYRVGPGRRADGHRSRARGVRGAAERVRDRHTLEAELAAQEVDRDRVRPTRPVAGAVGGVARGVRQHIIGMLCPSPSGRGAGPARAWRPRPRNVTTNWSVLNLVRPMPGKCFRGDYRRRPETPGESHRQYRGRGRANDHARPSRYITNEAVELSGIARDRRKVALMPSAAERDAPVPALPASGGRRAPDPAHLGRRQRRRRLLPSRLPTTQMRNRGWPPAIDNAAARSSAVSATALLS